MFKSAADEIGEWADRCRRWARRAQSSEQRLMLQSWERLFNQAESEAEESFDCGYERLPRAPHNSEQTEPRR
jgi:hypothetical protein